MAIAETLPAIRTVLRPRRRRPVLVGRAAGAALVVGVLSVLAPATPPAPVPPVSETAELGIAFVPETTPGQRPDTPNAPTGRLRLDRAGEPLRIDPPHAARETTATGGDIDVIEAPYLRLTLTEAPEPSADLFVILARRAAEGPNLSVIRTGARGRIGTKFGAVETLEATLAGSTRRVCTGFATVEAASVRIEGWLCAPLGRPPEPGALACTLDALDLDGGFDARTEAAFAEAARRRDPACDPIRALSDGGAEGRTGSIAPRRAPSRSRPPDR